MKDNYTIFNTFFEDEWETYVRTIKMLQTLQELGIVYGIRTEDVTHGIMVSVIVKDEE